MFTLHGLHSICKTCDNLRMRGRTSKSARNINSVRTTKLRIHYLNFTLTHLLETRPSDFKKSIFTPFKQRKLVVFKLQEFWDLKGSLIDRSCEQEQQLYVEIKV